MCSDAGGRSRYRQQPACGSAPGHHRTIVKCRLLIVQLWGCPMCISCKQHTVGTVSPTGGPQQGSGQANPLGPANVQPHIPEPAAAAARHGAPTSPASASWSDLPHVRHVAASAICRTGATPGLLILQAEEAVLDQVAAEETPVEAVETEAGSSTAAVCTSCMQPARGVALHALYDESRLSEGRALLQLVPVLVTNSADHVPAVQRAGIQARGD